MRIGDINLLWMMHFKFKYVIFTSELNQSYLIRRMLKAFGRAVFVTGILVLIATALWFHPIITIIVMIVAWLTFMFFVDPPEKWD